LSPQELQSLSKSKILQLLLTVSKNTQYRKTKIITSCGEEKIYLLQNSIEFKGIKTLKATIPPRSSPIVWESAPYATFSWLKIEIAHPSTATSFNY